MGPGDRAVVGIDPQLVEQRRVGQGLTQSRVPGASAWMVPRMRSQLARRSRDRPRRPSGGSSRSPNRPERRSSRTGSSGRSSKRTSGTVPGGRMAASTSSAARSAQIRSSRARHSMATRSRSRHCLMTKGAWPSTSTRRTTFETPPLSSRTRTGGLAGTPSRFPQVLRGVLRGQFPHGAAGMLDREPAGDASSEQRFEQQLELADLDLAVERVVGAVDDGDGQARCSRTAEAG